MEAVVPFAETNYRNKKVKFGIKEDDRRRHAYVIGKTGMGKTTLLENMVIDDMQHGKGVAVVDPHGEFAEKMLDFVPKHRIEDVIYFNPSDLEYPIAFNAIEQVPAEYRHLVTDGLVGVFEKLWAESWGPRLEYVLRNAILALLETPDSTLLGIMRILVDKAYRKLVIENLKDPVVRSFWVDEYSRYPDRFQAEAIAPIQNKVGQFLANPLIRNVVGQTTTAIDLRDVMDNEKVLIMNLSKGRIGEGTSKLLGAMMITKLQLAAMSRIDTPEEERRDFYLYVDEFQNFATTSFVSILSEARKYRLNLVLAHQYVEQLEESVQAAVLGNIGTLITFRVGATDAELFEKEFEPEFAMTDLVNLAKYQIYLKLMIDGVASKAFSASTLAPYPKPDRSWREEIIGHSRRTYATHRKTVEDAITAWAGPIESPESTEARGPAGRKREERPMWDAACWICQSKTQVPFTPDGKRPIYCKKCLDEIRAGDRQPLAPVHDTRPAPPSVMPEAPGAVREDVSRVSLAELARSQRPAQEQAPQHRSNLPPPPVPREHGRIQQPQRVMRERRTPDVVGLREILEEVLEDDQKHT